MEDFSSHKEALEASPFKALEVSKHSSHMAEVTQDLIERDGLIFSEQKGSIDLLADGIQSLRLSNQQESQENLSIER